MNNFCYGVIVGVIAIVVISLAVSRLLLLSVKQEPGNTITIDCEVQDGDQG